MLLLLDTESIVSQFEISKAQIDALMDYVVKDVTASYARRLEVQAKNELHKTRNTYIRAIKVFDEGKLKGSVLLDYNVHPLVRMLEKGQEPFDIKLGFERSKKRHLKANGTGWYLSIPFREGASDSIGESSLFSNIMPAEVHEAIKQKPAEIQSSTGLKSQQLKLSEIPEKYQVKGIRAEVTNKITNETFKTYTNKNSIYEGISKIQDSVTGQNVYMSFRRVSDKSDENSWIHSGIVAHELMEKAMNDLESNLDYELNNSTNNALNILGF